MTERNESVLEGVEITTAKNEMFDQKISMENEGSGLQNLPIVYQQQNIVVEVPVINGEPPAMLHSSRNIDEFSLIESRKTYGAASQNNQVCKEIEIKQCEQESSMLSLQKQERITRRRELNRFRMRALRASNSEVARRLRENNKFRMRMLRASDSEVAEGIRERNKYRMRELRSGDSQLIENCASTSLHVGEYLKNDQCRLNFNLEGRQKLCNLELDLLKGKFRSEINLRSETNELTCTCLVKEQLQEKSLNTVYCEQNRIQNLNSKSINITSNQLVSNTEQPSSNSVCNLINADCHGSSLTADKSEPEILQNEYSSVIREVNKTCEMQAALYCTQSGVLRNTALETYTHNKKLHCTDSCIVHTERDQMLDNFATHLVGKMGQYHRIKIQNDILSKGRSFTHFVRVEELEEQHKLIKGTLLPMSETSAADINHKMEQRREKGKLRMRLKRHSETEEEAQRRRESGRLRMRVLRASETEEQAARRRELNRIRMRMKRNSAKQLC